MELKEKVEKFNKFLDERTYTEEEINRATDQEVRKDCRRWNQLVKITKKEFEILFPNN